MHDEIVGQGERKAELIKYTVGHRSPPSSAEIKNCGAIPPVLRMCSRHGA
jgi:hypothetical protein